MPEHLNNHWNQGGYIWGVIWVRPNSSIYQLVESLVLIWDIAEAEEWINRLDWIPF